jgi:UDP-N-acetylglucosamine 2-epimerase (non-hydrolysing)
VFLNAAGANAAQTIGQIIMTADPALEERSPDAFLVLGDTNTCLVAIAAKPRRLAAPKGR